MNRTMYNNTDIDYIGAKEKNLVANFVTDLG